MQSPKPLTGDYRNLRRHHITCAGTVLPGAGSVSRRRHHIQPPLHRCQRDLSSAILGDFFLDIALWIPPPPPLLERPGRRRQALKIARLECLAVRAHGRLRQQIGR